VKFVSNYVLLFTFSSYHLYFSNAFSSLLLLPISNCTTLTPLLLFATIVLPLLHICILQYYVSLQTSCYLCIISSPLLSGPQYSLLFMVSNSSNLLEWCWDGVGTGTKPLQRVVPDEKPRTLHLGQFPPRNPAPGSPVSRNCC